MPVGLKINADVKLLRCLVEVLHSDFRDPELHLLNFCKVVLAGPIGVCREHSSELELRNVLK